MRRVVVLTHSKRKVKSLPTTNQQTVSLGYKSSLFARTVLLHSEEHNDANLTHENAMQNRVDCLVQCKRQQVQRRDLELLHHMPIHVQ